MRIRPWPFVIFALLQASLPLVVWMAGAFYQGLSLGDFLQALYLGRESWEPALFFGLPLAAAAAIFSVRIWSYPVLFAAAGWALCHYAGLRQENPRLFPGGLLTLAFAFQGAVLLYFLVPEVARIYLNP